LKKKDISKLYILEQILEPLKKSDSKISLLSKNQVKNIFNEISLSLELGYEGLFKKTDFNRRKKHLWHLFSWDVIPSFEGDQAINKLIKLDSEDFHLITTNSRLVSFSCINNNIEFSIIENRIGGQNYFLDDIYMVNTAFTWIYVIPHDEDCGPYFVSLSKE